MSSSVSDSSEGDKASKIAEQFEAVLQSFLTTCVAESVLSNNTLAAYESDLRSFGEFAIGLAATDMDAILAKDMLRQYFSKLYNDGVQRSTFLRKFSTLNRFCSFLLSEQKIEHNPMVSMKRPSRVIKLPKFLQYHEILNLVDHAKSEGGKVNIRLACIVDMLYCTGMRISELMSLKLSDVLDREKKVGKFISILGKGNKERLVPLKDSTITLLNEYLAIRDKFLLNRLDNGYLFISRGKKGHLTREQVGLALKKLAAKVGLDARKLSPHTLRHSFATHLCNQKIDLRVLQQLLGHADISTTEIYIGVLDREIVDFVQQHHVLGDAVSDQ